MRAFLLLLLALATGPAAAQGSRALPLGCKEDHGTCREDCTIEYGSSTRTYTQLTSCLRRCDTQLRQCRERHAALQSPSPTPSADSLPPPAAPEAQEPKPRSKTLMDAEPPSRSKLTLTVVKKEPASPEDSSKPAQTPAESSPPKSTSKTTD